MLPTEFSLIERFFADTGNTDYPARLSQGDDAAVLDVPAGMQAVMSIDTLIGGVHFPEQTSAADVACKALAVNLSDLAAMAAKPAWFLLSLSLPGNDEVWLEEFSSSLRQVSQDYRVELIGGDTCRGALSVTIQVTGLVPEGEYVTRAGARVGDSILVSGVLGNAALGLAHLQQRIHLPESLQEVCLNALNRPKPRLELADFLARYASAAIDLSDGLVGDLSHILRNSQVGAALRQGDLPVNEWIRENDAFDYALMGGDDYEICCTLPAQYRDRIDEWNQAHPDCPLSEIGEITATDYTLIKDKQSVDLKDRQGYQHFS
ncbi:MAG: thiamine-phosphate kinase [Proteobacteria bacterium]|nr:thiamine-phosphate kinase [Pseudomonadota bacterium]